MLPDMVAIMMVVSVGYWRCDWSKSICALRVKYKMDFEDLV